MSDWPNLGSILVYSGGHLSIYTLTTMIIATFSKYHCINSSLCSFAFGRYLMKSLFYFSHNELEPLKWCVHMLSFYLLSFIVSTYLAPSTDLYFISNVWKNLFFENCCLLLNGFKLILIFFFSINGPNLFWQSLRRTKKLIDKFIVHLVVEVEGEQCDQIGLFLKELGDMVSNKSSPNAWWIFGP